MCLTWNVRSRCRNRVLRENYERVNLPLRTMPDTGYRAFAKSFSTLSGFFFGHMNHADSTAITAARSDNQRLAVETGQLKESHASYWHCAASVSHAGVTARGFRLVKVEPRDSKSSELVPSARQFKQQRSCRVSVCNRLGPSTLHSSSALLRGLKP